MRRNFILLLLSVLVVGCQDAAARQRADQARTAASARKLKALGEDMHANQPKGSTAAASAAETQQKVD